MHPYIFNADCINMMEKVKTKMVVDPSEVFPCYRSLSQCDFIFLDEGGSVDRQIWLKQVNYAFLATAVLQLLPGTKLPTDL